MTRLLPGLAVLLLAGACIAPPTIDDGTLLVDVDPGSSEVTQLELRLSGPANQQLTRPCTNSGNQIAFELIAAGRYTLVVVGQDLTGRALRRASQDDIVVAAGRRTAIALRLESIGADDGGATDLGDAGGDANGTLDAARPDSAADAAADAHLDAMADAGADRWLAPDRSCDDHCASMDRHLGSDAAIEDSALGTDILVGQWSTLVAEPRPEPRASASLAYDSVRGVTVMFGGGICRQLAPTDTAWHCEQVDETWELGESSWTQRHSDLRPPLRSGGAMAFDSRRGRAVLFGGSLGDDFGWVGDLDDTWSWDGVSWTELHPSLRPPARGGAAMTYDVARDRLVLFGGGANSLPTTYFNDTWELVDGSEWVEQISGSLPPPKRSAVSMTYDPGGQRSLLYGGYTDIVIYADTWAWDGTNWTQLAGPAFDSGTYHGHWLTFDLARQRALVFEGLYGGRTREFDGSVWRDVYSLEPPPPMAVDAFVYDAARQRALLINPLSMPGGEQRIDAIYVYRGPGSTIDPRGHQVDGFPIVRDGDAGGHLRDEGLALAVDRLGQVWAAGHSNNALGHGEAMVWKFLPSGQLAQGFPANLTGNSTSAVALGIAVDVAGTVWVGGHAGLAGDVRSSAALWRLDQAGNLGNGFPVTWHLSSDRSVYVEDIDVSPTGEVWGAGWIAGTATETNEVLLYHWTAGGGLVPGFPQVVAGAAGSDDSAREIAVASTGDVFMCGGTRNAAGDVDVALWRFDSDGVLAPTFPQVWGGAAAEDDGCYGLALEASQAAWLVGYTGDGVDADLLLLKYDAGGALQAGFPVIIDGGAQGADLGRAIAVAPNGAVWVAGAVGNTRGDFDFALWRLDSAGVQAPGYPIVRDSDAGGLLDDFAAALAIDPFGYVWATGTSCASDLLYDFVLWKFE